MRNLDLTPGSLAVVSEEFIDGMTVVEDLIFRDKVDIAYDPRVSPRRRRIEWPTADTNIQSHLSATNVGSSSSPTSTKSIINNELAKCDVKGGLRADLGVYDELFVKKPNYSLIMRNLYWRARRQSAIWDVFELLVMQGFL